MNDSKKDSELLVFQHDKHYSIKKSNEELTIYNENAETEAYQLAGQSPIILDTNVLLGYYRMTDSEREKFKIFLTKNQQRIYITYQIEEEFLRNRIGAIRGDINLFKKFSEIHEKFKTDIKKLLASYSKEVENVFVNRFDEVKNKLLGVPIKIEGNLSDEHLIPDITKAFEKVSEDNKDIEISDSFLEICSKFQIIPSLNDKDKEFLVSKYKEIKKSYNDKIGEQVKAEQKPELGNERKTTHNYEFPGCKETGFDSYGDFIIFHELLAFVNKEQQSCVFLTNDIKGDWVYEKGLSPIPHYITNVYALTNQIIYIAHAKAVLDDIKFKDEEDIYTEDTIFKDTTQQMDNDDNGNSSLKMVLAGQSFDANISCNLYYHQDWRSFRDHKYIGLYKEKAIKAIGEIENIIYADIDTNGNVTINRATNTVTEDQKNRIKNAELEAKQRNWDISTSHVFFCVKQFYPTRFIKTSLYAPWGTRYFDLLKVVNCDTLPKTSEIANLLKEKTWK